MIVCVVYIGGICAFTYAYYHSKVSQAQVGFAWYILVCLFVGFLGGFFCCFLLFCFVVFFCFFLFLLIFGLIL